MEAFESFLKKATARGSDVAPGAVVAVVDKDGNYLYKNASGFNGVAPDAKPLEFDQTYFIASCTKLIASIAGLQAVEHGLIGLDDPLDKHLPELTSQPIAVAKDDGKVDLQPATKAVTLRQLLTHSSGAVYDLFDPALISWRQSRGETPGFGLSGNVDKDYAYPRAFEAGEGWQYGGGLDWAGLLVARLNNTTLEQYIDENISKPLGITTFTWHLSRKPHVAEKLMNNSSRQEDGTLGDGPTPIWAEPQGEGGGAGLYSNVHDYTRVLSDLLKESPVLLKKDTVDLLFSPQFAEGSEAHKALKAKGDLSWALVTGGKTSDVIGNYGLGGFLVQEDIVRDNYVKPKGTLTWSGMPNLVWSVNRERGLALLLATQVLPWADPKTQSLGWAFETAVWKHFSQ